MVRRETKDGAELVQFYLRYFRRGSVRHQFEAAQWLTERGWGKAPQVVEDPGDRGPRTIKVTWREDPA
jgi:hypothetical protein